ncbi:MAG: GHKL domain-containing protein [Deltaproteobacteria bacterium]|nr:GHKL domain-containing protein [Deltaproteobacteria bacterium]
MFLRLMMLFAVLFPTVYQGAIGYDRDVAVKNLTVIFFTFLVTTVFIFLYEKAQEIRYFLASQIAYDVLFTTALIFYSNTNDSPYSFFYFLNIIFAAVFFRGRGALAVAISSGALFILLGVLRQDLFFKDYASNFVMIPTALIAIALLSGQLVEDLLKSRQKISRLEVLSEEIVDSLDSGLLIVDAEKTVQKINRVAQSMLGPPAVSGAVGRPLDEVIPGMSSAAGGAVCEVNAGGKSRKLLVSQVVLPEKSAMILLRDLSELLELEEKLAQQERLAGIGRLAAGVAHEIRNPVASISGSAQLLLGEANVDVSAEERARLFDIIVRECSRVERLVARLLDFAKPVRLERENLRLREFVRDCVETVKARPDFRDLRVEVVVRVPEVIEVSAAPDPMREVITNLLVNAMQAFAGQCDRADQRVVVEARRERSFVELSISDNGPGIPAEYRRRVFDPFFTTRPEGTGLGLAQVYKILKEHQGSVELESEEGRGTRLRLRLPA